VKITFYGVRGSIPCPGPDFIDYGGNTTFIVVQDVAGWAEDEFLTLDFGSGAKGFSDHLSRSMPLSDLKTLSLFSHFHWDHINGFPFFAPIYVGGNTIRLFSNDRIALRESVAMQSNGINFPVEIHDVPATLEYNQILHCQRIYAPSVLKASSAMQDSGETVQMAMRGLIVDTLPLNHPQGCTGYRIWEVATNKVFVYVTDHESNRYVDLGLAEFMSDSNLVYMDGMYDRSNVRKFRGYGHSSWEECAQRFAEAKNTGGMLIGHHNHTATDQHLDAVAQEISGRSGGARIGLAKEGMEIEL